MNEERSTHLLERLEQRAAALLGLLRESRVQQDALQSRLAELERRRVELEASHAERAAEVREEQGAREALAQRCRELQARVTELEATRLELAEENRELDEQNRELEAHNRRLLERDPAEAGTVLFHRQARRAQGLSALIGHRPRKQAGEVADAPADPEEGVSVTPTEPAAVPAVPADPPVEASTEVRSEVTGAGTTPELDIGEAPSPQALLDQWYRRYSSTFFKGHTRPLKVGIHEELSAREPWPEKLVRRALACYVNLPRYLKSVREGAWRLDLAGEPAGQVDAAAAEHAHRKLERLQADRRNPGRSARPRAKGGAKGREAAPGHRGADGQGGPGGQGPSSGEPPSGAETPDRQRASSSASPNPASPSPGAPERRGPATLDEKLSALLAKHNQR
ncbi:hypothetical protein BOX17_03370 [Halomonas aestuarii]|uniref:ProQ/FinO domain-containing protein n=1 Tax=Halomonas aestuarii TaxID=1897729 RepID=A0A1J0VDF6_9GAMM|nr:ProQ/FINO family protein [Halomonas aestuarii]APE30076.1 hypothetical protein BOX17_03370 [Halomonas aestuarii]